MNIFLIFLHICPKNFIVGLSWTWALDMLPGNQSLLVMNEATNQELMKQVQVRNYVPIKE